MDIQKIIEFKNWADDTYLKILQDLTYEQQQFTIAGYKRSIHHILWHMYEVYWYWYHFATDKDYVDEPKPNMSFPKIISAIKTINFSAFFFIW